MNPTYSLEPNLSASEFRDLLIASTLSVRRPVDDIARLDTMLRQANLIVCARLEGKLIGVARALTDYSYCCYLSDLAVDVSHQRRGIGRCLIKETRERAGKFVTLILLAAPASETYYKHLGMNHVGNCFIIPREY